MFKDIMTKLYIKESLSREESEDTMRAIMEGRMSGIQVAALLIALHMKGESVTEIASFARVMREKSVGQPMSGELLDTCGTGGDQKGVFNISTATAFVVAACGVAVAKHGNRGVSSTSGSADILQNLGIEISLNKEQAGQAIEKLGIGFLFAQSFHPAMKHVAPVRKELGVRTVFNILGPIANPLFARNQLMGVFAPHWTEPLIHVLYELGENNAIVFHSKDGLDEISLFAPTQGYYFQNKGEVLDFCLDPGDLGFAYQEEDIENLKVNSTEDAQHLFTGALTGEHEMARDIVALNAGVGLWLMGRAQSIREGLSMANKAIDGGQAYDLLQQYIRLSRRLAGETA
jgi:anthranilate phosphoribosyltransferase